MFGTEEMRITTESCGKVIFPPSSTFTIGRMIDSVEHRTGSSRNIKTTQIALNLAE